MNLSTQIVLRHLRLRIGKICLYNAISTLKGMNNNNFAQLGGLDLDMQQTNPNICINLFPLVSQLGNNFHLYTLYIKMLSYRLQEKHFHFLYPL